MLVLVLIIAFIVAICVGVIKDKTLQSLKKQYDDALKGTDKAAALDAGRAYYEALRKGKMTPRDENTLTNDLATMDTYVYHNELEKVA